VNHSSKSTDATGVVARGLSNSAITNKVKKLQQQKANKETNP